MIVNSDFSNVMFIRPALRLLVVAWVYFALISATGNAMAETQLNGFKMVQQDNLMLHFDLDSVDARADMFMLREPHRLVIDLLKATLGTELPSERFDSGVVEGIRYAQHGDDYLRVVLDLRRAIEPVMRIVPRQGGQRLIVDMGVSADASLAGQQRGPASVDNTRNVIVAIDAGHGGKDPGAVGYRKSLEKDIVLDIAIRLHNQLVGVQGIKPVLIREDDVYINLRHRMEIARQAHADIFVSIHADAINHKQAYGSSVYALSMDGATSEAAAWLADSENQAAALYGDVSLSGLEDGLARTLINLTQGNTMERSLEAGAFVLKELEKIGPVHKRSVEQAAFAVLKSPDIPSILIETAFISNPEEEKKLANPDYQEQLAGAIASGLYSYLSRRAPAGTLLAAQRKNNGS